MRPGEGRGGADGEGDSQADALGVQSPSPTPGSSSPLSDHDLSRNLEPEASLPEPLRCPLRPDFLTILPSGPTSE